MTPELHSPPTRVGLTWKGAFRYLRLWLALILAGLPLSTQPAAAQSNAALAYTFATIAGLASGGHADGVGTDAQFNNPYGVAVDRTGNLYVTDSLNDTIRTISPAGVVTTLAGLAGIQGSADGTGSAARFHNPTGVAVDGNGNVYVADKFNGIIRKVTPTGTNWVVTTLATQFTTPHGVAVDSATNLYVADAGNHTICKATLVGANWVVTTLAGQAGTSGTNDGAGNVALFNAPEGVAVDSAGNLYVADTFNHTIRKLSLVGTNWVVTTLAGLTGTHGSANGTGTNALFYGPWGVAVDTAGNLYVADTVNGTIRKVTLVGTNWVVTTLAGLAGTHGSANGTGTNALFYGPVGVAVDTAGNVYVADQLDNTIRAVSSAGAVTTVAGTTSTGSAGSLGSSDGTGRTARFYHPSGVAVDSAGTLYVADQGNSTIRKVTSAGLVTTLAGLAGHGQNADGIGSTARFAFPYGVAVDSAGTLYVADQGYSTIRKVTPAGVVTTLAGRAGSMGTNDGTGSAAQFNYPNGVAVDNATNLYVADARNNTIRKVTPVGINWVVTTLAGQAGTSGTNDGAGDAAFFNRPEGVAVDSAGNLYVADTGSSTIRKLTPTGTNWVVTTLAGLAGIQGSVDGTGSAARFDKPYGVAVDSAGNLYVADTYNETIRKITPVGTNWLVLTIAGSVNHRSGADGAGSAAQFAFPEGIAVDRAGNVYVADTYNNTMRKGSFTQYGQSNPVLCVQPLMNGQLTVTLLPPEAHGQ